MMEHHHHHHHQKGPGDLKLSFQATWHCLIGCGLGEVAGMVISRYLGMANVPSIILAVLLGFIFGFALGIIPLLRADYSFSDAFKHVLIAEGASILVMETAEVLAEVYIPGVMAANLNEAIFWIGMFLALTAGFIAAFPINLFLVKRGIRHHH